MSEEPEIVPMSDEEFNQIIYHNEEWMSLNGFGEKYNWLAKQKFNRAVSQEQFLILAGLKSKPTH